MINADHVSIHPKDLKVTLMYRWTFIVQVLYIKARLSKRKKKYYAFLYLYDAATLHFKMCIEQCAQC